MSPTLAKLTALRTRLANSKEKAVEVAERSVNALAPVAAGAADGFARSRWGDTTKGGDVLIPNTSIDVSAAMGVVMVTAGVTGYGGKASGTLASAGGGLLACYLSRVVEREARKAKDQA